MGKALELVTVQGTALGASFAAMAALTGDSLVVRNSSKKTYLVAAWQQRQVAGGSRIVSPLLHDNVRGIQFTSGIEVSVGFRGRPLQELQAQDTLTITGFGSAVAGDIEQTSVLIAYDDLPGIDGNFIDATTLFKRAVNRVTVRVTPVAVATGQYSAGITITSTDDVLKANTNYAVIGMSVTANSTAYGIRSPDWGNLRVGIPGAALTNGIHVNDWFIGLSMDTGLACIPVFNSANKNTTLIDYCDDENAVSLVGNIHLVELK